MTEECEQVRIDEQAFARAADLIAHDLTATLGWETGKAQAEARHALGNRTGLLPTRLAWDDLDRVTQQELLDEVVAAAVEVVQQFLHDTFVDTFSGEACNAFRAAGRRLPDSMLEEVAAHLCRLEGG